MTTTPTHLQHQTSRKPAAVRYTAIGLSAALAALLAGCGSADEPADEPEEPASQAPETIDSAEAADQDDPEDPATEADSDSPAADEPEEFTEAHASGWEYDSFPFPECSEMEAEFGDAMEHLVFTEQTDHPPQHEMNTFGVECTWQTEDSGGVVIITIYIPGMPIGQEEAEFSNSYFQDDRAEAIGGYVRESASTELDKDLNFSGMTVHVEGVEVTIGAGGMMYETGQALEPLTNDWGIETAVKIHELIW